MAKTKNSKHRRNIKTRRLLRGGKPNFIKIVAYNKDGLLVDYKIMYDSFNKEDQKKYSDLHRVYYSIGSKSLFGDVMDLFKIEPKIVSNRIKSFFSLPGKNSNYKSVDYQTIAIHHPDDLNKIRIANQMIDNINKDTTVSNSRQFGSDIDGFIGAYKPFIGQHKEVFLKGVSDREKGWEMLNTPVFLEIIGNKYGFITEKLSDDLDTIKEKMDMANSSV